MDESTNGKVGARRKLTVVRRWRGCTQEGRRFAADRRPAAHRRGSAGVAQGVPDRRRAAGAGAGDCRRRREPAGARVRHHRAAGRGRARRAAGAAPAAAALDRAAPGARRPQLLADALRPPGRDHRGDALRGPARERRARVRARRGGPRPGHHPRQHPPPGAGADDHRPQLPGEDQRQHRQLGHLVLHSGRGGQAAVGHALGRRHGHGPVHRAQHPRDARVDPPQQRRCPSAPCPSTRRWRR